ncbi:MAG: type I glyceraldehyde-3-phosphate dehydrogenase [Phycisphaerales bacterium JB043]
MTIRIGINGFGRIGRLVTRAAQGSDVEVVAVNDLVPAPNLAYMLKYDSVHGRFDGTVDSTDSSIIANGSEIKTYSERDPSALPWGELGVDYVLEATGLFTTHEGASKHLAGGAKRVLISAPTKDPDTVKTLAFRVNHEEYDPATDTVVSNASCTTNCLAPVAKVIEDSFGLEEGLMTTVHAVTATQPTQDGPSKKDLRGGRNGYANIIPASTGAAKAVALCIPSLKGKLTGMAFRVPTADVSCVDLTFRTGTSTSLEHINAAMRDASESAMRGVLAYTEEAVVSSDFIGDPHSSIYDAGACIELNDRFFKVVSWYDNEYGYASRCVDMLRYMASRES